MLNEHRNFQEPSSSFVFFMKLFITEVNADAISRSVPPNSGVCVRRPFECTKYKLPDEEKTYKQINKRENKNVIKKKSRAQAVKQSGRGGRVWGQREGEGGFRL